MNTSTRFSRRLLLGLAIPVLALSAGACGSAGPVAGDSAKVAASAHATDASNQGSIAVPAGKGSSGTRFTAPTDPRETLAAQTTKASVKVFAEANEKSKVLTTLGGATALGSKTTMLVVDRHDGWVDVSLPTRPNGSTGWVKAADVDLRANPMAVAVDRSGHMLIVTHDGDVILKTKVAVGSNANPTPAGHFYVTDLIETDSPTSAYGPFAFGLSGHSDTLSEFGGGDGQLGVHGTDDPSSIGKSVSHGCVRVPNDVAKQLAQLLPLGTPVTVV